jgi:hypothetical protein
LDPQRVPTSPDKVLTEVDRRSGKPRIRRDIEN